MTAKRTGGDPEAIWSTRTCLTGGALAIKSMRLTELRKLQARIETVYLPHARQRLAEGMRVFAGIVSHYAEQLAAVTGEIARRAKRKRSPRPAGVAA